MKVKEVTVDGKTIRLGASGNTPFVYMNMTGRDINKDMNVMMSALQNVQAIQNGQIPMSMNEMEIFADLAYVMAYQGRDKAKDFPQSRDEWLDELDGCFTIYSMLPEMLELWGLNIVQSVEAKKNPVKRQGK